MSQEIIEGIKGLSDIIKKCQEELKVILTDTEKPLPERWEIYEVAVGENVINEFASYGPDLITLSEMKIYNIEDYVRCERCERVEYVNIVNSFENFNLIEENINKVKKEILSKFLERGFTYDW